MTFRAIIPIAYILIAFFGSNRIKTGRLKKDIKGNDKKGLTISM